MKARRTSDLLDDSSSATSSCQIYSRQSAQIKAKDIEMLLKRFRCQWLY